LVAEATAPPLMHWQGRRLTTFGTSSDPVE
jgi:hypothetical protein